MATHKYKTDTEWLIFFKQSKKEDITLNLINGNRYYDFVLGNTGCPPFQTNCGESCSKCWEKFIDKTCLASSRYIVELIDKRQ